MLSKVFKHVQRNAIAYVALFFAVGGGGAGAAIAATAVSSGTVHACVSKKNGALYVAKRCSSSERALSFNQRGPTGPAGPSGVSAIGEVDPDGTVVYEQGMKIIQTSTGNYNVEITTSSCKSNDEQIPMVTPLGYGAAAGTPGATPGTYFQPTVNATSYGKGSVKVQSGYISSANGDFVGTDQGFYIYDECVKGS
jgi:hypothetical protein